MKEEIDAYTGGGEVRASRGCLGFLRTNSFQDCVLYGKTMNVCHSLLAGGRPCQHDRQTIHGRRCSTHIMYKMVQPYYLQLKKGKVDPKPMVKMKVDSVLWEFAVPKQQPLVCCDSSKLITQGNCIILEGPNRPLYRSPLLNNQLIKIRDTSTEITQSQVPTNYRTY